VSTIVRRHVGLMLDAYDRNARRAPIVFATLPGERHEIGLLTSAMMCASRGFKTHYLGPDLPPAEIARFAREVDAAVVALSVVLHGQATDVPAQLRELVDGLPAETAVWLAARPHATCRRNNCPRVAWCSPTTWNSSSGSRCCPPEPQAGSVSEPRLRPTSSPARPRFAPPPRWRARRPR